MKRGYSTGSSPLFHPFFMPFSVLQLIESPAMTGWLVMFSLLVEKR